MADWFDYGSDSLYDSEYENLLDGKNADGSDISKPLLCDVTLNFILDDINLRIEILKVRDATSLNTARMHELLLIKVYLQDMILNNIK
jgi:hypothetical protein